MKSDHNHVSWDLNLNYSINFQWSMKAKNIVEAIGGNDLKKKKKVLKKSNLIYQ